MEQWEYKIISPEVRGWISKKIDPKAEQFLNELGSEGWELTGIAPFAGNGFIDGTENFVFIFKRKKI